MTAAILADSIPWRLEREEKQHFKGTIPDYEKDIIQSVTQATRKKFRVVTF